MLAEQRVWGGPCPVADLNGFYRPLVQTCPEAAGRRVRSLLASRRKRAGGCGVRSAPGGRRGLGRRGCARPGSAAASAALDSPTKEGNMEDRRIYYSIPRATRVA